MTLILDKTERLYKLFPPHCFTAMITFSQFSPLLVLPVPEHPPPGPPVPGEDPVDDLDQELAEPLQEVAGGGQQLLGGGREGAVGGWGQGWAGRGQGWAGRVYLRPGWISHVSLHTNIYGRGKKFFFNL